MCCRSLVLSVMCCRSLVLSVMCCRSLVLSVMCCRSLVLSVMCCRSLVLSVMCYRSFFVHFRCGHCLVCPSSIYSFLHGFLLPLWYIKLCFTSNSKRLFKCHAYSVRTLCIYVCSQWSRTVKHVDFRSIVCVSLTWTS